MNFSKMLESYICQLNIVKEYIEKGYSIKGFSNKILNFSELIESIKILQFNCNIFLENEYRDSIEIELNNGVMINSFSFISISVVPKITKKIEVDDIFIDIVNDSKNKVDESFSIVVGEIPYLIHQADNYFVEIAALDDNFQLEGGLEGIDFYRAGIGYLKDNNYDEIFADAITDEIIK